MSRQVATNVVATPLLVSFSTPFYSHLPRCTRPKSLNRSFSFSFSPSISLFVCTRCPRTTDAKTSLKGRMVFLLSGYKWICLIILRIWIRTELLAGGYYLACWNKQKCWLLFVRKIRKIRKMVQHSSGLWYHHSQSSRIPNQKPLFPLSDIFFGIIYSAYRNHPLSVYIIRPGTPYTSILLSPSGEGSNRRVDVYKKPRVEETKKGREESGRGRRDSRLNQRAKYKKERGGENRKKRSITRKSGGRREISFTRSVRKPFDASNQRHDVRILIIEAFICTTTIVRPAAKWPTYLFVPPE